MAGEKLKPGSIVWRDLTVKDAAKVRDFYCDVVGWTASGQDMGGYEDFNIHDSGGDCIAGVCHSKGSNANAPPQWLMYIAVDDVPAAAERCKMRGGKVIDGPRPMGSQTFCVIQDPAGAFVALIG